MELVVMTSELMPQGNPKFLEVVKYPMIREMVTTLGRRRMLALITLLVKDFCASVNVVRNMNEDQMIEVSMMLLDECGNFRLEDYVMMFSLAKRGQLVKIMDRIDISIITQMLDAYWEKRNTAAKRPDVEIETRLNGIGSAMRITDSMDPQTNQLNSMIENFGGSFSYLRSEMNEKIKIEKGGIQ